MPTPAHAIDQQQAALSRAQAFAEGAKLVLVAKTVFDGQQQENIETLLREIQARIADVATPPEQYKKLMYEFIVRLSAATGLDEKDIVLGESYWVWQCYQRPARQVIINIPDPAFSLQIAEAAIHAPLTQAQKELLVQIHASPAPAWAKQLRPWERTYLKKNHSQDASGS